MAKLTFALYFGNRGIFPETLLAAARQEVSDAVKAAGHDVLMMDTQATRFGAVETVREGQVYAKFLKEHAGKYDGVILSLPNFGDENGAVTALRDCGVPILVQAYPDDIGKMDFAHRRDSFCGKLSITDVFYQYGLKYTVLPPHVCHPDSPAFAAQLLEFAAICRIVKAMRRFSIGAIGARTTLFKTVRFDELALQRAGITCEALDLSDLFQRVRGADIAAVTQRVAELQAYADCTAVPGDKLETLAKTSVAIDTLIADYQLDAVAVRCWPEIQTELGISVCLLMSWLNDHNMVASCEMDVATGVAMRALAAAADGPSACLDWNNNYGDDPDKCILFHCGPIPQGMMEAHGSVQDNLMLSKGKEPNSAVGCNIGRITPAPITYAGCKTDRGEIVFYLGEGRITGEPIEQAFFGCAGVAYIPGLQQVMNTVCTQGFRHHVAASFGTYGNAMREALGNYLGYRMV